MSSKVGVPKLTMSSGNPIAATGTNRPVPLTSTMKIRDEVLTCRLCFQRFHLFGKRPLALRCMHTFCEECLVDRLAANNSEKASKGWMAKKTPNQVTCPTCESKTPVGKEVDSCRTLPVNPSIMELLQILENSPAVVSSERDRTWALASGNFSDDKSATNPHGITLHSMSQQQQQLPQHLNKPEPQQPVSNLIIVKGEVASNRTISTAGKRQAPEPPTQMKAHGERCSATVTIGNADSNERRTDGIMSGSSAIGSDNATGCSQNLISSVSIGTASTSRPARNEAAMAPDQSPPRNSRDNTRVHNGAVVNQPTSGAQTSMSTSVHVGAPASATAVAVLESAAAAPIVQLCGQCQKNPAHVTVTSASKMTSLQLCSECAKPAKMTVVQQSSSGIIADNVVTKSNNNINGADVKLNADKASTFQENTGETQPSAKARLRPLVGDVAADRQHRSSQIFVGASRKATNGSGSSALASVTVQEKNDTARNGAAVKDITNITKNKEINGESQQNKSYGGSRARISEQSTEILTVDESVADCITTVSLEDNRPASHHAVLGDDVGNGCVTGGVQQRDERNRVDERGNHFRTPGELAGAPIINDSLQNNFEAFPVRPHTYGSAPNIDDIHPPPCDNPPYNPDYRTLNSAAANAWQRHGCDARISHGAPRGNYTGSRSPTTPPPAFQEKNPFGPNVIQINGQRNGISGRNIELTFGMQHAVPMPEHPPKYEEVVTYPPPPTSAEFIHPYHGVGSASVPPASDVRMPYQRDYGGVSRVQPSPGGFPRLVRAFGKYSENSTQPTAFRSPTRISSSELLDSRTPTNNDEPNQLHFVVVDRSNATVQVFTPIGECLSMLHVSDVSGCCLWAENRRLVAATDNGIQVFDINGSRLDNIPLGLVLTVVRYQRGFIAVQSKSMSIFKGPNAVLSSTLASKATPGQYNRLVPFNDIRDVAVNSQQDLVVLESVAGGASVINIMTEDGFIKSTIMPSTGDPCGTLKSAVAVTADHNLNVFVAVADTDGSIAGRFGGGGGGRIIMFGANGRFLREFFTSNVDGGNPSTILWPAGITVGVEGQLYAVIRGEKFAEIRVYAYA